MTSAVAAEAGVDILEMLQCFFPVAAHADATRRDLQVRFEVGFEVLACGVIFSDTRSGPNKLTYVARRPHFFGVRQRGQNWARASHSLTPSYAKQGRVNGSIDGMTTALSAA